MGDYSKLFENHPIIATNHFDTTMKGKDPCHNLSGVKPSPIHKPPAGTTRGESSWRTAPTPVGSSAENPTDWVARLSRYAPMVGWVTRPLWPSIHPISSQPTHRLRLRGYSSRKRDVFCMAVKRCIPTNFFKDPDIAALFHN